MIIQLYTAILVQEFLGSLNTQHTTLDFYTSSINKDFYILFKLREIILELYYVLFLSLNFLKSIVTLCKQQLAKRFKFSYFQILYNFLGKLTI